MSEDRPQPEISALNPFSDAFSRTGRLLFSPFNLRLWLGLGLCVFLAQLGHTAEGFQGFNYTFQPPAPRGPAGHPSGVLYEVVRFILDHWVLALFIGWIAVTLVLAVTAILFWLSARGTFMMFDGLVHQRGNVIEPWRTFRDPADSLFVFNFCVWLIDVLNILAIAGIGLFIALPDILAGQFTGRSFLALSIGVPALLLSQIAWLAVWFLTRHVVAPVMYRHRCDVLTGWSIAWRHLIAPHWLAIILFALLKAVIAVGIGILEFVGTCLTCCIAALPYIGTVLLLPLYAFTWNYTLLFVGQFPAVAPMFPQRDERCPLCGYDRRYLPMGRPCPECGHVPPVEQTPAE